MIVIPTTDTLPMVVRADHVPGPSQGEWTYDDYAALPEDGNRYEIIDGVLYMAPSPNIAHQDSAGSFYYYLRTHIQNKGLGRVLIAPIDVEFAPKVTTQPDVLVVLNDNISIITKGKIMGAPDLVVEIASPGTATYDRNTKLNTYAHYGVKEYWIAEPITRTVELLILEQGAYRTIGIYQGQAKLPSKIVPDLPVRIEEFFV